MSTALGLVALMVISRFVMQFWVDLYARDYGGLGVVLALYFWIAFQFRDHRLGGESVTGPGPTPRTTSSL